MCIPRSYKTTVDRIREDDHMDHIGTDLMEDFLREIINYYAQQFWEFVRRGVEPGMTLHEWTMRCLTVNYLYLHRPATVTPFDMHVVERDNINDVNDENR
uniref:Uncharacterized protein n=1 Tax=Sipha flava TaxID=143950 RepID=A0A2S2Q4K2_9HEMI